MPSRPQSKRMMGWIASMVVLGACIALYFNRHTGLAVPGEGPSDAALEVDRTAALAAEIEAALEVDSSGLSRASIVFQTTRGRFQMRLFSRDAPKTVRRFVHLVRSGFYNGLGFHRVEPGFVIQGGDPTSSGVGGSGLKLVAEFNSRPHLPGTVGMARGPDPDTADSQFYVTLARQPDLDGKYTVFGQVTAGIEVIQQIQLGDRMNSVNVEIP